MQKRPAIMTLLPLLPWVLAAWSQPAVALGLGKVQAQAILGSPLALTVELKTEASDALTSECVDVVVLAGDAQVPRSAVSVLLDAVGPSPSLKIRTTRPIDEPLARVQVSLGCGAKVQRNYQFLLDPPGYLAAPPISQVSDARNASGTVSSAVTPAVEASGVAPSVTGQVEAPAAASAPAAPSKPATSAPSKPKASPPKAPAAERSGDAKSAKSEAPTTPASKPAPPKAPVAAASGQPQLKLEAGAGKDRSGLEAAAQKAERDAALKAAEESANVAQEAAKQATQRLADMDKALESLRQEAKANSEAVARLTAALAQAESRAQPADLPPLWAWGAMGGLLLLSGGLAWQLRRAQRRSAWNAGDSTAFLGTPPHEENPSEGGGSPESSADRSAGSRALLKDGAAGVAAAAAVVPTASVSDEEPPLTVGERTQLHSPPGSTAAAPMRSVSIEELLDLEQQVEFFNVLGQDDEAINLLVEHLRKTGGTYPLPYLKLMEIYRRREDREAYERIRERFNQRFNAVAAAWGAAPQTTRSLDEFPEAMARIEAIWQQPMDAMAHLENMLFRTEGGEMLDLSALGDVLTLYTLARELHDLEDGAGDSVDVLLPFGVVTGAQALSAEDVDDHALNALQALSGFGELDDGLEALASGSPPAAAAQSSTDLDLDIGSIFDMAEQPASTAGSSTAAASSVSEEFLEFPLGEPQLDELFAEAPKVPPVTATAPEPVPSASGDLLDLPLLDVPPALPQAGTTGSEALLSADPVASDLDFELPAELSASQSRLDDQAVDAPAVELDLDHLSLDFLDAPTADTPGATAGPAPEASLDLDFDIFKEAIGDGKQTKA